MKKQLRIHAAWRDCSKLYQRHQTQWSNLLDQAFEAAYAAEKQHRRHDPNRWTVSARDAALWFAVKWFLDVRAYAPIQDWAEVCSLRDDCRLAFGAMSQVLRGIGPDRAATEVDALREQYADVLGYDYSEWVSR